MKKIKKSFGVFVLTGILLVVATLPLFAKGPSKGPGQAKNGEDRVSIGNLENIRGDRVVISNQKSKAKTEAVVDQNTKVVGQGKKELQLKDIKPKDTIAIISSSSGEFATSGSKLKKAVKIFVQQTSATESAKSKRRAIQGVITSIAGNLLTLSHQIQRERTSSVAVNDQTVIKIKGLEDATLANLEVGQRVAVMGDLDEGGVLLARRVHVIPGKATGIFRRLPVSTPSATLTVTPTATETATPSATPSVEATPSVTLSPIPTSIPSSTPIPTTAP
ncbi:MAG: DUF5666 domain-containing protein [bacterium]|nr:DUF5666 domain-containing protein [bacterium]